MPEWDTWIILKPTCQNIKVLLIINRRDKKKPFFIYLAYIAPHFSLQAKRQDIKKYKNIYKAGYDSIRIDRFRKQIELGLFSNTSEFSKSAYSNWEEISDKDSETRKMAVYAAMMDCMDQNIGRIMNALDAEGIGKNIIVCFLSDNGACSANFNKTPESEIGTRNSNSTYGDWYNVSNTPYRKYKRTEHEGGIITPMIFSWPKCVKNKGSMMRTPARINDFMPTVLEITGVEYPSQNNEVKLDPLDGESFLNLLNGSNDIDVHFDFCANEQGYYGNQSSFYG